MIGSQGEISDWYVYPAGSWKTFYANQQISETKAYLRNRLSSENKKSDLRKDDHPFPPIYLFLIFLLSMAFLWVERKFQ
jgi:hypothetical protein